MVAFLQLQPEAAHYISQMVSYLNQWLLLKEAQYRLCHGGDWLYRPTTSFSVQVRHTALESQPCIAR